jgi:hypothetical protein
LCFEIPTSHNQSVPNHKHPHLSVVYIVKEHHFIRSEPRIIQIIRGLSKLLLSLVAEPLGGGAASASGALYSWEKHGQGVRCRFISGTLQYEDDRQRSHLLETASVAMDQPGEMVTSPASESIQIADTLDQLLTRSWS